MSSMTKRESSLCSFLGGRAIDTSRRQLRLHGRMRARRRVDIGEQAAAAAVRLARSEDPERIPARFKRQSLSRVGYHSKKRGTKFNAIMWVKESLAYKSYCQWLPESMDGGVGGIEKYFQDCRELRVEFDNIANIAQSADTMAYKLNWPTLSGLCIREFTTEGSEVIWFTWACARFATEWRSHRVIHENVHSDRAEPDVCGPVRMDLFFGAADKQAYQSEE